MKNIALQLTFIFGSFQICSSHLCLLTPKQRGNISGLNTPASEDCMLTKSPCGARDPENPPQTLWTSTGNYTVIFQKNLNHYTSASPGYFSVSLMNVGQDLEKELIRVPDRNENSLHLYTVTGPLPLGINKDTMYIVQVSYITKNPKAPPAFYQCADVLIL